METEWRFIVFSMSDFLVNPQRCELSNVTFERYDYKCQANIFNIKFTKYF